MVNISNIKIKNFKSIKEVDISLLVNSAGLEKDVLFGGFKYVLGKKNGLAAYNVFFGRNSIGKSSMLEALSFLIDLHNNSIASYVVQTIITEELGSSFGMSMNIFDDQNEKRKLSEKIENEIFSAKGPYFQKYERRVSKVIENKFNRLASDKTKPIEMTIGFIIDDKKYELSFVIHGQRITTKYKDESNSSDKHNPEIVKRIQDYFTNSVPTSGDLIIDEVEVMHEANYTRPDPNSKEFVEGSLMRLRKILGQEKMLRLIKLADPLIDDIVFTQRGSNEILNKIIVNATAIDSLALSTGTRQFILILAMILSRAENGNCLVMIDEIELSLHKELIDVLKIIMNKLFIKKNVQFLVTAHSPLAVHDFTSFKQIYSITKDENNVHKVDRLSTKFKNHQNIINRYLEGDLAIYPDSELSRNVAGDIID